MIGRSNRILLGAAAACALWAAAAQAQMAIEAAGNPDPGQNGQVNISGATLFQSFFSAPASTNDWINANRNFANRAGSCNDRVPWVGYLDFCNGTFSTDQLAKDYVDGNPTWWLVQYRGVGSVNGLGEFVDYQLTGALPGLTTSVAYINRKAITGQPSPQPQTSVDIAVMDVPTTWATRSESAGTPAWMLKPAAARYGDCPLGSYDTGYDNRLGNLVRGASALNTRTTAPDADTVFDTPVCWVGIAIVANRGTALQNVRMSDLQTLFVTGRLGNGENLATVTRSKGSGTRNGAMNSIGVDPSWANGDNLGSEWVGTAINRAPVGPGHQVTNCEGSGELRNCVQYARLGVGYNGLTGSSGASADAIAGKYEVVNVSKDIDGDGDGLPDAAGTAYVRPSLTSVVNNADPATGWQIGGPETFATRGDPWGTTIDFNPTTVFLPPSPPTQWPEPDAGVEIPATRTSWPMANIHAAAYIRNIMDSAAAFSGSPGLSSSTNMPGEFMAYTFFLTPAVDALPDPLNPTRFVANTVNAVLQAFVLGNNELGAVRPVPAYGSKNAAGLVPSRKSISPDVYSDGSSRDYYNPATGAFTLAAGVKLNERNQTAGDFDYRVGQRHARNLNDLTAMMGAIHNPRAADAGKNWDPVTNAGGDPGDLGSGQDKAIAEILGDHNGDGNFDDKDVRYAADGLAIDSATGKLDRKKGFQAVDNAWTYADRLPDHPAGNYFNTTLATGKVYVAGDSRADIAGAATAPTPGANPVGADGMVNATDIDYVLFNTRWSEVGGLNKIKIVQPGLFSAVPRPMDLSADINGDLTVNTADVDEIVQVVLGTGYGDVNLDGHVDAADEAIINAHLGQPGGWAAGDMNGDGQITAADHDIWAQHVETYAPADFNHDHRVNAQDLGLLNNCASGPSVPYASGCGGFDLDTDGDVDQGDFGLFQRCYSGTRWADPWCQ